MNWLIALLALSVVGRAEVVQETTYASVTTQSPNSNGYKRTTSDVVAGQVSRIVGEDMTRTSDVAQKGESVHDSVDSALFESGKTLKHMGRLVAKVGGAIKVAGRWLFQRYGILGPSLGLGTFQRTKSAKWVLEISALGNNTLQTRVAKLTAKTISAFSSRGFSKKGHVAFEQLGDIVGSAGDVLEEVAQRLAGDKPLPFSKLTESDISFVSAVNDIIKGTK